MAMARRHALMQSHGRRALGSPDRFAKWATARVLLCPHGQKLIALHGFMKKTLKTPYEDLKLPRKRKKDVER